MVIMILMVVMKMIILVGNNNKNVKMNNSISYDFVVSSSCQNNFPFIMFS